ncbi:hypothetical protein GT354_38130 [Streptomyces sp. SID3343]|nr:hypothetical protein [Streptomyces sp. SID3343]
MPAVTLVVAGAIVAAVLATKGSGDDGPASLPSADGRASSATSPPAVDVSGLTPYPTRSAPNPSIPTRRADEGTFGWVVPTGWTRKEQSQSIVYNDPAGQSVLSGRTAFQQTTDLLEQWRDDEAKAPAVFPAYRKVIFEERAIRGRKGVVWEYTWTESGIPRHAVMAAVIIDGIYIEVDLFGTEQQWPRDSATHAQALTSFTPATRPAA